MIIKCRVCNTKNSKFYYSTNSLPEYIWPTKKIKISKSSCKVFICKKCGHIQLQNFTYKKITKFYGSQSFVINNSYKMDIRRKKIIKLFENKFFEKKGIEIGGGVNPFAKNFNKNYYIVDTRFEQNIKKKFKKNALSMKFENFKGKNFDYAILLHTLEHIKNPSQIVKKINKILSPEGRVIVEVPNFFYDIKFKPYYSIFHQHLSMFSLDTLKNVFFINGFKLQKIFTSKENIFICFKKTKKKILIKNCYNKNKIALEYLKNKMHKINSFLKNKFHKNKFILQGAGGSSSLIIHNFPLFLNKIEFALDKDPKKSNLYIPGTNIKIFNKKSNKEIKIINLVKYFKSII